MWELECFTCMFRYGTSPPLWLNRSTLQQQVQVRRKEPHMRSGGLDDHES